MVKIATGAESTMIFLFIEKSLLRDSVSERKIPRKKAWPFKER